MPTPFAALKIGLARMAGAPGLLLALWLLNVAVALPATWIVRDSIEDSIEHSLAAERLRQGFDMEWYGEYRAAARGIERTFEPGLTGAAGFYDNLQRRLTGRLFRGYPGLVALGIAYALIWAALLGGVIERYVRGPYHARPLLVAGARCLPRLLRLALLSGVLYYGTYRLHGWLMQRVAEATRDTTSEGSVLFLTLLVLLVTGAALTAIQLCSDYAKVALVADDRRSAVFAALRGVGFVVAHPWRTGCVHYGLLLASGLLLVLYGMIGPGAGQSGIGSVVAAFLFGQLFLVARLALRLAQLAGATALYPVPVEASNVT